jgi:hypothetical protein
MVEVPGKIVTLFSCDGGCTYQTDENGDLVIGNVESYREYFVDENGNVTELSCYGPDCGTDTVTDPNPATPGKCTEPPCELANSQCASFALGAAHAQYVMQGHGHPSGTFQGAVDVAAAFSTCMCQTTLAGIETPDLSGVGLDGQALLRAGACPTSEDQARIECATNPYGPDDAPKQKCLDLLASDMALLMEERVRQNICTRVQCPATAGIATIFPPTGASGGACACVKREVVEKAMNPACAKINCGGGVCTTGGGLGALPTCKQSGQWMIVPGTPMPPFGPP